MMLAELADGRRKRLADLSAAERDEAYEVSVVKRALIAEWTALITDLGEEWVIQTPAVMRIGVGERPDLSVREWRNELARQRAGESFRDTMKGMITDG